MKVSLPPFRLHTLLIIVRAFIVVLLFNSLNTFMYQFILCLSLSNFDNFWRSHFLSNMISPIGILMNLYCFRNRFLYIFFKDEQVNDFQFLRWIDVHVISYYINIKYEIRSLFIIRANIEMRYTSSMRKHGSKVITKDNKRRHINILSHVNTNNLNNLK